jgi:cytochrome c5
MRRTCPHTRKYLVLLVLAGLAAACGTTGISWKPVPGDEVKVSSPGAPVSLEELQHGYKVYVTNCSGCHYLHLPNTRSRSEWEALLPEMLGKAQLDSAEKAHVRNYIFSKL